MSSKKFEEDDPLEMVGVVLPPSDRKHLEAMAETFVEEYLRMGWPDELILGLFKQPFYQGPHMVYRVIGEEQVKQMIMTARIRVKGGRI